MIGDFQILSPDDIEEQALRLGFLPYFKGKAAGFSIEEHTPPRLWFSPDEDGPWEWKGEVIRRGHVAYGKFFRGKAVYVALGWLPRLANVRRAAMPLMPDEKVVLDAIVANESMLTTEIREECGFAIRSDHDFLLSAEGAIAAPRRRGLDSILSRLQMSSRIVVQDFEYKYDKRGHRYGWGVARYSTPECLYADSFAMPAESPEDSCTAIDEWLVGLTGLPLAKI